MSAAKDLSIAPISSGVPRAPQPVCVPRFRPKSSSGPRCWRTSALLLLFALLALLASAESSKLSEPQREQIIRAFLHERPFARRALPLGKAGLVIEGSKIAPSEGEMNALTQRVGFAVRPGERVHITEVRFVREGILFDINGGPTRRKKWTERISVGMTGPDTSPGQLPSDEEIYNLSSGSSVLLKLEAGSGVTAEEVKRLLAPVLDFASLTQSQALGNSVSPAIAAAVKAHRALVGMDRDTLLAALGRPPRRIRESSDGQEYEEWIYGAPPQEVQFIRFVHGKVVRIEQMKVDGEKLVRTQDEVGPPVAAAPAQAAAALPPAMAAPEAETEKPRKPPTLLRPGEHPARMGESAPVPLPASAPRPEPPASRN